MGLVSSLMAEKGDILRQWYGAGKLDGYLQPKKTIELKPFKCPGCGDRFSSWTLTNHWQKHRTAFGVLLAENEEPDPGVKSVPWPATSARKGSILKPVTKRLPTQTMDPTEQRRQASRKKRRKRSPSEIKQILKDHKAAKPHGMLQEVYDFHECSKQNISAWKSQRKERRKEKKRARKRQKKEKKKVKNKKKN